MCEVNKFRQNGNPTEKQLRAGNTAERVKTEAGGSRRPVWGRGGESATVRPPEREGARGRLGTGRRNEEMLQTRNAKRPPGGQLRSRPRDGRAVPMPPRPRSRDSKTGTASSGEQRHGVLSNVPLLAVFPVKGMGIPRPEMRLFGVRIILSRKRLGIDKCREGSPPAP